MTDYLTIDGLRIAYTSAGTPSNPLVILIHGIMSHRGVWTRTIEVLKDRYFCVAVDLPGFGDSDKPRNAEYSISKQAERVLKVVEHFGFNKFTVIGHSMGGQISIQLAATLAPGRVQKLVSVDGVVTGKLIDYVQNLTRRLVTIGAKVPSSYKLSRVIVEWEALGCWMFKPWFYKAKALPFESWHLDRRMAMNPEIAISTSKAWSSLNVTDLTACLSDIAAPTLVIFGKQDGTVSVDQAYLFKEKLPSAQLSVIDECGHFPMYEKFDEYILALEDFLNAP